MIELNEARSIISLPATTIMADIKCKMMDENNKIFAVKKVLATDDIKDAFRRASEGYFWEEGDGEPHAVAAQGEELALIYIPENAIFFEIVCRCIDPDDGGSMKIRKTMSLPELARAFKCAEMFYIDENDTFTVTDLGKEWLDRVRSEMK